MTIFLTGSTGFLGGKLLNNLMQTTTHTLFVLVRDIEKAKRLVQGLPGDATKRITLLQGDITKTQFGLGEETVNTLKGQVDIFYHIAALVKFDEELRDELFEINYIGTKYALELAMLLGVEKFFYISTAYTVGKRDAGIEELYPIDSNVHNPYEESKIIAEHLVFSYANQMKVSIFRPSIIVGDSETGEADSEFTLYGFMRALDVFKRRISRSTANTETIYRVLGSKHATSNFVPVNYVADILAIAVERAESGMIYNITNPSPTTNYDILTFIKKALDFERLEIIEHAEPGVLTEDEEKLNGMIHIFNAYLSRSFPFDDRNTQRLIEGTKIVHLNLSPDRTQMIINAYSDVN